MAERFGKLEKFDYLLHQRGPDAGKPRGYAFIAYERAEDARLALAGLNGLRFGERHLAVHYANDREEHEKFPKKTEPVSSSVCNVVSDEHMRFCLLQRYVRTLDTLEILTMLFIA